MNLGKVVYEIAEILKELDSTKPVHKHFQPGIGPFGEPQIVKEIANGLSEKKIYARTHRIPDMSIGTDWAIEFKIARPFGDNGNEAENWSVNLLHPYEGNVSSLGDCCKLNGLEGYSNKAVIVLGYEHSPAKISLDPLFDSFEIIATNIMKLNISQRVEESRSGLVHPEHQRVRVVAWQLL